MINPHIYRQPNGVWVAVAAVPAGSRITTVKEIVDERPFRDEAYRRIAHTLAPIARQMGFIGAAPGTQEHEKLWKAIHAARKAASVEVDKKARAELMHKIGIAVRHAASTAERIQRRAGGLWTSAVNTAVNSSNGASSALLRMRNRDPEAISLVMERASKALQGDQKARSFMIELIAGARPPERAVLRNVFAATPAYSRFLYVLDRQVP